MDINEITTYIEQNKDSEPVKNFIAGFYTPERLAPILDSETGAKILQPRLDKYHSKGLETFKANNLPKLIDDEIAKRYPGESEDQKRIKKIESDLENQKLTATREKIKNMALTKLSENKMPAGLADLLIADDEDTFTSKFNSVKTIWDRELDARIKEELKKNGRTPHKDIDKGKSNFDFNKEIREAAGFQGS
jgi:hypothetical protein